MAARLGAKAPNPTNGVRFDGLRVAEPPSKCAIHLGTHHKSRACQLRQVRVYKVARR